MTPSSKVDWQIKNFITPILIGIVGFLLNDKLRQIEDKIDAIDELRIAVIQLRVQFEVSERKLYRLENLIDKLPAKKEDEIQIPKK